MRDNRLENEILQRVDELVQCAISISLKDESTRTKQLACGITLVQEMGDLLLEVLEGREQHLQALLEQLVAQRLPDRRILQSFGNFPRDIQYIISEGTARYLKARQEKGREAALGEESRPAVPGESVAMPEPASPAAQGGEIAAGHPHLETQTGDMPREPVNEQFPGSATIGVNTVLPAERQDDMTSPERETSSSADPAGAASGNHALEALRLALLQAYPEEEIITGYETRAGKIPFFLPRLQLGFEPEGTRHDWRHEFYCRQQGISIRKVAAGELANPAYLARRLRREAAWRQLP